MAKANVPVLFSCIPQPDSAGVHQMSVTSVVAAWLSKNWPPSFIAELSDRLAKDHNMRVVLTGAKEDIELANAMLEKFGGDSIREITRNYEGYLGQIKNF